MRKNILKWTNSLLVSSKSSITADSVGCGGYDLYKTRNEQGQISTAFLP